MSSSTADNNPGPRNDHHFTLGVPAADPTTDDNAANTVDDR